MSEHRRRQADGRYRIAHPRLAQQYRLNVGTIVQAPMVRVRLARRQGGALAAGRVLGEVEEYFIEQLVPGDSFVFAGEALRFEGLRGTDAIVTRSHATEPKICYPFEGRLAHQSLGMLLTRRLERVHAKPLGFVANEYALAVWGLADMGEMVRRGRLDLAKLFDEDMLGDDLDAWLAESSLMKRSFRVWAIISGPIERRHPEQEKTGRQMTVSSDLIYDVLRQHEPDHILLQVAFADAATGLIDVGRLSGFLQRIRGRIRHIPLSRISPLAVPAMLEIGRESVPGDASEALLREAVEELIAEAMGHDAALEV